MSLSIGTFMPSFADATEWLHTCPSDAPSGLPTLVQFWAVSCPMCKRNMPRLQELMDTYTVHGLRLISVHMPRMESDMDVDGVRAATQELGLTGPCAIDNGHVIGDLFQTGGVWPSYFLFDAQGKLRSRAAGALGLKMAENSLRRMLGVEGKEPESVAT